MASNVEIALKEAVANLTVVSGKNIELKVEQRLAVESLLHGKDVMAILPTGYGKSLIFQLFSLAKSQLELSKKRATVLVVCPLQSIARDQVLEATAMGLVAAGLEDLREIGDSDIPNLVFASAEAVKEKWFGDALKSHWNKNIEAVAVDESHTVETWTGERDKSKGAESMKMKAFRGAYAELSTLRSFCKQGTPFVALTGTADNQTQKTIVRLLALTNPVIICISPERQNVRISVSKYKRETVFSGLYWLLELVKEKGVETPKTIIFCNTIPEVSSLINFILWKLGSKAYCPNVSRKAGDCLVGVYHSMTWASSKELLVAALKGTDESEGKKRIIIATTALSMGVNFPDITYVINWGPARSLIDYHQEAGRAGRNGQQAHSITIYHGNQAGHCEDDVKSFIRSEGCLHVASIKPFYQGVKPLVSLHNCCCNCSANCKCQGDSCSAPELSFEADLKMAEEEDPTSITRAVTATQKGYVYEALLEIHSRFKRQSSLEVHGFSLDLVKKLTENCHKLFTVNDILTNFPVFSVRHALKILEVIHDIFEDIGQLAGVTELLASLPSCQLDYEIELPSEDAGSESDSEDIESVADEGSW